MAMLFIIAYNKLFVYSSATKSRITD